MFNLILDRCCRVFEAAIAFCLALMVVLVFMDVLLGFVPVPLVPSVLACSSLQAARTGPRRRARRARRG